MKAHFWYSEKQDNQWKKVNPNYRRTFARINGEILEYSETQVGESKPIPEPLGSWDDYKYLGYGEFDHYGHYED